jgi:hypothetical protein
MRMGTIRYLRISLMQTICILSGDMSEKKMWWLGLVLVLGDFSVWAVLVPVSVY